MKDRERFEDELKDELKEGWRELKEGLKQGLEEGLEQGLKEGKEGLKQGLKEGREGLKQGLQEMKVQLKARKRSKKEEFRDLGSRIRRLKRAERELKRLKAPEDDFAVEILSIRGKLKQPARVFCYHDRSEVSSIECYPQSVGIDRSTRAVPLPADMPAATAQGDGIPTTPDIDAAAESAAHAGLAALAGEPGPARDSLVYAGAIVLHHLGRHASLAEAADSVRNALDSGAALARFKAAA